MTDFLHFITWYLIITVLGWVTFPIAFKFFPNLRSRGFAFVKPLGLLLWGFVFWLCGSLGIFQNNLGGVVLAFVVLLAAAAWVCKKDGIGELLGWIKTNRKTIITMEVVFLIVFGLWTVVRATTPEASATEKPMELAFINSILRSPSMPPRDPWLSGYAISYYYFGYVLVSMVIRVSGVASSIGFNLAISLWFGLTALAVYGVVFDLIAGKRLREDSDQETGDARAGAFLGPFFVLIISTLEGVLEFLYSGGAFWKYDAQGNLNSRFWSWLNITEMDVPPPQPFNWLQPRPSGWLWWRGSRVIQDLTLSNSKLEVIQEFPFFSYLLADLHPHVLAMPFVLLAVAFGLNLFFGNKNIFTAEKSVFTWFKHFDFWIVALVMGSLAFFNTWDFPIYVGLFCLIIAYLRYIDLGWGWSRVWEFLKSGVVIGITGILLFLPFYLGFKSQAGGILPSMEFMTRGIHFWILFGALLIPIFIWLISKIGNSIKLKSLAKSGLNVFILFLSLLIISLLFGILIFNLEPLVTQMMQSNNPSVMSLGSRLNSGIQAFIGLHGTTDAGVVVGQALIRRLQSPGTWITLLLLGAFSLTLLNRKKQEKKANIENESEEFPSNPSINQSGLFVVLLMLIGIALTAFPEFFYLRDNFGTRMNTIFKFYFQAWILWSVATAYASVDLLKNLTGIKRILFSLALMITFIGGLAYPVNMLWNKTNHFDPAVWTLDGNAYIASYTPDDYAAMQWLGGQPDGVLTEAVGGSYSDYARVSTRTGMPTVLGWPGHEGQWRGGYTEVGSRESDVRQIYSNTDWPAVDFYLQKYDIRYVYFGSLEKTFYATDGLTLRQNLPVVYENNSVTIFLVPDEEGVTTP